MESSEDRKEQTAKQQSLFPTAVSEDQLDEARRKSSIKQIFGSSKIFLVPGGKPPPRPDLQGSLVIRSKAAEHNTNGKAAMGKCQYEKAVICFSRAATLQPQQTELCVNQAEAYLQLCDFQSAAACYRRVWLNEPGAFGARLAFIYYLQGQCLFDRGLYSEALEAFGRAAQVKPGCRVYEVRSLACLAAAGHHTDCLKMVNDWMLSDGPTSDLYVLRARLHKLLHQTSRCHQDVMSALALKPACPAARVLLLQLQEAGERARRRAVDRAVTGQLPEALRMINVALENRPQDARLYLFRGILYRRLKDFTAAIEDLVQAVELSEEGEEEVRGQDGRGSVEEEVRSQNGRGSMEEEVRGQDGRGSVEEEVRGQDGHGSVEEEVRGQDGCGSVQEEEVRGQDGRGSVEEEVRGQDGCGSVQEEEVRGQDGHGSVEQEVRGQDGCGSVQEEEVRGQDGCGSVEEEVRGQDGRVSVEDKVRGQDGCGSVEQEVRGQDGCGSVEEEVHLQLVLTYNDFAVQCFSRGLYAEATLLLNKAIEEEKSQAGLYLNRGDCFFKQGQWCFALADYQQAEEMMRPADPAVRLRLAVLHNTLGSSCFQDGCFQEAADRFSLAVRYDPAAGRYYENRSKAFRRLLNLEGARRDLICMLVLDPTNEELPPMLMSLFPGRSVSEVLSSPAGQEVRVQLMDSIQACSSSSDPQRLSEELLKTTLTNEDSASPSEELKLGGNQQEVQITVRRLLQVVEGNTSSDINKVKVCCPAVKRCIN